ncbi:hypothetical protein BCR32DRAFT_271731 [Anaeromyces robustus]|uniref:Doublecortin domain-containing protein n=1 Tax=Anaeromyces robustus TaxID=1754192 RepID=A0A1Y1WR08_9FUNG|nr:hypothetical protein BCR32DRAFT_271731 [Anaeromyces robustus]|eukprot:ORX75728.1 hypothetical protein BCR32DRAFT_271731 [Anaeromyces robustus]
MKKQSVTERLTDPSKYTGSHKERFDANGKGRGLAGREDLCINDGNTSSKSRNHAIENSVEPRPKNKPVVHKVNNYGTTAKKVTFFEYANKNHAGEMVVLTKQKFPTMKQVNDFTTAMIPTGKSKLIFDKDMKQIKEIDEFIAGEKYLILTPYDKQHLVDEKIPIHFKENK